VSAETLGVVGAAALVAVVMLMVLPVFQPTDLNTENLRQLNEAVEQYHRWLEKSWILLVVLCVTLLASAWLVRSEVSAAKAKLAGRVIKGTAAAKVVVGILAACSFVGGDLKGRLQDRVVDTTAAKVALTEVRLEFFPKAERILMRQVVITALEQVSDHSSSFNQVWIAYNLSAPYLADLPSAMAKEKLPEETKATRREAAVLDVSLQQAAADAAALDQAIAEQTRQDELVDHIVELVH
jgi:hypothetical protein